MRPPCALPGVGIEVNNVNKESKKGRIPPELGERAKKLITAWKALPS